MASREWLRDLIRERVAEVVADTLSGIVAETVAEILQELKAAQLVPKPTELNLERNRTQTRKRIDKGVLTERMFAGLAKAGVEVIHIARDVVITPLAREKARALHIKLKRDC